MKAAEDMEVFYSRCLLCTRTPDVTPHLHIFSEAANQLKLHEKINKYLNIQIESELPQNVCHSCMEKLEVTHGLVTSSQQARVTLLQIKQQSGNFVHEVKQEISDCSMMHLDPYLPTTDSSTNFNESCMDFRTNEIPVYNSSCSHEDFDQSDTNAALNSNVERTRENTVPFEEVLISEISIEEHVIKQEPSELLDHQHAAGTKSRSHQGRRFRNLKCAECEVNYIYPEMLTWHIQNCHGSDANVKVIKISDKQHKFQCILCESVLRSQELTIKHLHSIHKISNLPFKCSVCDRSFLHKSASIKHQINCEVRKTAKFDNAVNSKPSLNPVDGVKCKICNDVFESRIHLKSHILIFHAKKRRELHLKCLHCIESFHSFPSLKSHCHTNHPGKYILKCEICNTTFISYEGYSKHAKYKHGPHEFTCNTCDATFSSQNTLEYHVKHIHSQLSCTLCDAKFKCKSYLQQHIRDIHTNLFLTCEFCDFKTHTKLRLNNHLKSKHLKKKLSCDFCSVKFKFKPTLYDHIRSVHMRTNVQCPHCSYSTHRRANLKQHIKLNHTLVKKTLSCSFCSSMFKCNLYLRQHVREMHTGPMLHCAHCTLSTRRKYDLMKHIRCMHLLPNKLLVCQFCGAMFKCEKYLKQHVRDMHTGKIINCEYCEYTTRRRCNLKMHHKRNHLTSK